jgi:hypothetical protein
VTESYGLESPLDDIEAIVRAAGDYVRASDDLRPRVLEAARMQHGEQRTRRRLRYVAVCVLLVAFCHMSDWNGLIHQPTRPSSILVAAGFHELLTPTRAELIRSGDGDWRMVEAFTKLRRQQAQLLRCEI